MINECIVLFNLSDEALVCRLYSQNHCEMLKVGTSSVKQTYVPAIDNNVYWPYVLPGKDITRYRACLFDFFMFFFQFVYFIELARNVFRVKNMCDVHTIHKHTHALNGAPMTTGQTRTRHFIP